jgi:hypothetical protein
MPWEKAEYFHRILVALSANGEIIPRILFSANKFVRAKKAIYLFGFLEKMAGTGLFGGQYQKLLG